MIKIRPPSVDELHPESRAAPVVSLPGSTRAISWKWLPLSHPVPGETRTFHLLGLTCPEKKELESEWRRQFVEPVLVEEAVTGPLSPTCALLQRGNMGDGTLFSS